MTKTAPKATAWPALVARDAERFFAAEGRKRLARFRFGALVVLTLLVHAGLLAYFLYRDDKATLDTAQIEETPIEVVVEKPPEPPQPKPEQKRQPPEPTKAPPPPEPPKIPPPELKEDLSPATSAPRAVEDKQTVETKQAQPKTASPAATAAPPSAPPEEVKAAAPPAEAAASKPADDRPDSEALDKAKPDTKTKPDVKDTKTKPTTKASKPKTAYKNAAQQLAGLQGLQGFSIEAPAPRVPVAGGTEDVRYLAIVQGMIERRVHQLPQLAHYQAAGSVVIYLHIDHDGRMLAPEIVKKSGNPAIDKIALDAVKQAGPFPPPPRMVGNDFYFSDNFDAQLPMHVTR